MRSVARKMGTLRAPYPRGPYYLVPTATQVQPECVSLVILVIYSIGSLPKELRDARHFTTPCTTVYSTRLFGTPSCDFLAVPSGTGTRNGTSGPYRTEDRSFAARPHVPYHADAAARTQPRRCCLRPVRCCAPRPAVSRSGNGVIIGRSGGSRRSQAALVKMPTGHATLAHLSLRTPRTEPPQGSKGGRSP